jgi:hypothetical protein
MAWDSLAFRMIWVVTFALNIWFSNTILNHSAKNLRSVILIIRDSWNDSRVTDWICEKRNGPVMFPGSIIWISKLRIRRKQFRFQHATDSTLSPVSTLLRPSNVMDGSEIGLRGYHSSLRISSMVRIELSHTRDWEPIGFKRNMLENEEPCHTASST